MKTPGISKIDLYSGYVAFSDDTFGAVIHMMDEDGEDTNHPSDCVSITVEHNIHGRLYVELMNGASAGDWQ